MNKLLLCFIVFFAIIMGCASLEIPPEEGYIDEDFFMAPASEESIHEEEPEEGDLYEEDDVEEILETIEVREPEEELELDSDSELNIPEPELPPSPEPEIPAPDPELPPIESPKIHNYVWRKMRLAKTCRVRRHPSIRSLIVKIQRGGVRLSVAPYNNKWLRSHSGYMHEKCFR